MFGHLANSESDFAQPSETIFNFFNETLNLIGQKMGKYEAKRE
jgi:hypothetical protein